MAQYYFLGTLLPPIKFGEQNDFSFSEFKDLLYLNLQPTDLKKFEVLLRFYDWINLRAFWKKQPLGLIGTWDEHHFDALSFDEEEIPKYLKTFVETYPHKDQQIAHFSELLMHYYKQPVKKGFLSWWLKFEGGLRLNMTAIRALDRKKDLDTESVFKDPEDEEIADIKAEVEARDYHPKEPYLPLLDIYKTNNPLELDQALDRFRFKAIEEWMAFDHFSINYILAYAVLYLINLKFTLRSEKGAKTIVEHYLKEVF